MKTKVIEIKVNSIKELHDALAKAFSDMNNDTKENKPKEKYCPTYKDALAIIAEKKGWTTQRTAHWLSEIHEISPVAAFNIVARVLAIELDKKYKDHITNSDKVFVISTLDGRIHELNKTYIKNYRNFAAFRTLEDAKIVCNILREPLRVMFRNDKKGE